jgi:hypothetical protein
MARVTTHAHGRLKERSNVPKRAHQAVADKALSDGVTHSGTAGSLHRYMDCLFLQERTADNMRIYNYLVFLFRGTTLMTVFQLPHKYYAAYDKAKKRQKQAQEDVREIEEGVMQL